MYQFYFLSILCNFLIAFALVPEILGRWAPAITECVGRFMEKNGFPVGLGIAGMVVGVFKLLSVTPGDLVLLGDFFPALAGIAGGGTLVFEGRGGVSGRGSPASGILENLLVKRRDLWGIAALLSASLHFFFPSVLFL